MIWKLIFIGGFILVAVWFIANYVKKNGWIDLIAGGFILASLALLFVAAMVVMRSNK